MSDSDHYLIAWVCDVTQYVATQTFLDEVHDTPDYLPTECGIEYILGCAGGHNVVIAVLQIETYGPADRLAKDMLRFFPNVRICLLIGISSGAPCAKHNVRLGDIVVAYDVHGDGLENKFDKIIQDRSLYPEGSLNLPSLSLREAAKRLQARDKSETNRIEEDVKKALNKKPSRLRKIYNRPDAASDQLYQSQTLQSSSSESTCNGVCGKDISLVSLHGPRPSHGLEIHHGFIDSYNQLTKNALVRNQLDTENNVSCLENTAAELRNAFPCLVIRGICDSPNLHQKKEWQGYTSMVAAAYAKYLLSQITTRQIDNEGKSLDIFKLLTKNMDQASRWIDRNATTFRAESDLPKDQHKNVWFHDKRLFERISEWQSSQESVLWLHGKPGAGKTTLPWGSYLVANSFFRREKTRRHVRNMFQ